ncbi:MAG: tetratricopeptide repeat protein [Thermodesulfobacteriota bacterium]|nr:tetratricopeptide repeat protein [Thermodesulfobacteriota bacterium]
MKPYLFLFVLAALALSGCSGNRAEELFDTARLEELQNNDDHARKLYQEIVAKYPNSEYAADARDRLSEMQKKQ